MAWDKPTTWFDPDEPVPGPTGGQEPGEPPLSTLDAERRKNLAATKLGLLRQKDIAQKGPQAVAEAQQSALRGLRGQAARAFAQEQARGGGGSLARMRQSALSRGVAEGELAGDFAQRRQAAEMAAARGETEYATESEKLNVAERKRLSQAATAYNAVKADFQEEVENLSFVTDADRATAVANIRAKYANADAETKAAVERALANIESGQIEAKGAMDVGTAWYNPVNWF